MKTTKKLFYITMLIAFAGLISFILINKKNDAPVQKGLIARKGSISLMPEWLNTKKAIESLENDLRLRPENTKTKLTLAEGYIQEGRITGNHGYYDKAALDLLQEILKKEPDNFDALCCQATIYLSQHHFSDALTVAEKAVKLRPNTAFGYGLMCDADVELGNYKDAIQMADKMVSTRPDMRSYSRVSYLREIHGDLNGAIEAMKLAVSAGYPGLEETAWSRAILGSLYEKTGDLDHAEEQYNYALYERPDYPFALAGLGKIEKAKNNFYGALKYFEKAKSQMDDFSFSDELTDLYFLVGNFKRSEETAQNVIALLQPASTETASDHGHYSDRELAYAYLKAYDYNKALRHALIEYDRRPENIDVCETLAWVRYKRGEYSEAKTLIDKALKTNCKNPVLLCRAGLINYEAGNKAEGKSLVTAALKTNPFMEPLMAAKAKKIINGNEPNI